MKGKTLFRIALTICAIVIATNTTTAQYKFDNILYGAEYYWEYMPTERMDEDIKMMKEAGVTAMRVGESTWGVMEPQEGKYEFEWLDRVIDALHEADIKVIIGTPTYSVPAWLAHKHPEILAKHRNGGQAYYGIRQNIDINNPTYLFYCEKIIRQLISRYANHPAVIGYQVDNEVEPRGINNFDKFVNFRNYVKERFDGNLDSLTKEWGMNYWGMNINTWEEFYTRDGVTNPSYKNEWERHNRKMCSDFLNWQCDIINEYKRDDQFITHDYMTAFLNIDQIASSRQMQYPGINVYHSVQAGQNGHSIAYAGDYMRTIKGGNYLVMETNAQGIGWDSRGQHPPFDGQLRQNLYSHLASGANMVLYWHWATCHYGQETFWKGILGHELQPNRIYNEFTKTAGELKEIGTRLVNLKKSPKVAILFSHDSQHGLNFMQYSNGVNYQMDMMHYALYSQNIETDIVACDQVTNFDKYDLLVIPSLYIAADSLLEAIDKYVYNGGHVVMMLKSGYLNEHSAARTDLAPGPLRKAAGFYYQEYSCIGKMALKGNPFGVPEQENLIGDWYEFLIPETATPLAYGEHPFFGKWPVITSNNYGKGKLIYLGANPTQTLLNKIIKDAAIERNIITEEQPSFPIIVRQGVNDKNNEVTYIFNYSDSEKSVKNNFTKGTDLLTGKKYSAGDEIKIEPWGVVILE